MGSVLKRIKKATKWTPKRQNKALQKGDAIYQFNKRMASIMSALPEKDRVAFLMSKLSVAEIRKRLAMGYDMQMSVYGFALRGATGSEGCGTYGGQQSEAFEEVRASLTSSLDPDAANET